MLGRGTTEGIVLLVFLASSACGGNSTSSSENDAGDKDAAQSCTRELTVGHCLDGELPCTDFGSSTRQLLPLPMEPQVIDPIIGFQGSPMFVLGVETRGLQTGPTQEEAYVQVTVELQGRSIGGFQSFPIFSEDTDGRQQAPQLFVVVFEAENLVGETVGVEASATGTDGTVFCGEARFIVGELIESEQ